MLDRTAQVAIPPTSAGQKVPVVFHFHGKVSFYCFLSYDQPWQEGEAMETLITSGTSLVTAASLWLLTVTSDDGRPFLKTKIYHKDTKFPHKPSIKEKKTSLRTSIYFINPCFHLRNVYSEPSKADDVQFTLDLIEKVGEEIPAADMDNVNIIGL